MANYTCGGDKVITVITGSKSDNEVQVSVTDCGPGVEESDNINLFEAFYTTKDLGLGMGLTICRNIINAHGGELWYTNNESVGATFHFSLPINPK